jgi:hypothetical protein
MDSFSKIQNLVQIACLDARGCASKLDVVHVSICDLATHAFVSELLTLKRMTSVLQAVRKGIEDSADHPSNADISGQATPQRQAYRGLCTAANEGLAAAGLAFAEFRKFSGRSVSAEFRQALLQEATELKLQIDQITVGADWVSNAQVTGLQAHWFDQLLQIEERNSKQEQVSTLPWSSVFFQSCGYETRTEKTDAKGNLMLLGLITNGALRGLQLAHTAA